MKSYIERAWDNIKQAYNRGVLHEDGLAIYDLDKRVEMLERQAISPSYQRNVDWRMAYEEPVGLLGRIESLEKVLDSRDGEIIDLKQTIEARDHELENLSLAIKIKNNYIDSFEGLLKERDDEVESLSVSSTHSALLQARINSLVKTNTDLLAEKCALKLEIESIDKELKETSQVMP